MSTTTRRFDYYTIAITCATILGIGLLIPLFIMHYLAFGQLPAWLAELLFAPFFVSQIVSGSGYIGRFVDYLVASTLTTICHDAGQRLKIFWTSLKQKFNSQAIGLALGLTLGLGIAIGRVVLHVTVPYASFLSHAGAEILFFVGNMGNFGGLGNRLGRVMDYALRGNHKPWQDFFRQSDVNYTLGIAAGVVIGVAIVIAVLATSVATVGVLPAVLFSLTAIGVCASASGYVGRVADYVLGKRTAVGAIEDKFKAKVPKETITQRHTKENVGTTIGVIAGIAIASILIIAGVSTLPFFGVGVPKIFAGLLLLGFCVSGGGGLGNRVGHTIDNIFKKPALSDPNVSQTQENFEDSMIAKPLHHVELPKIIAQEKKNK